MKKKILIVLSLIIVFILIFHHTSYAKYVSNSIWDYYLNSKNFYFESDYLNNKNNVYNSWDGKSISFNLKNSLNDKVFSNDDIKYEVTCMTDNEQLECLVNNEKKYTSILEGNKLSVDTLTFDIIGDVSVAKVTVVAKAISPYKKTLTADFELTKTSINNSVSYDIVDYDNYSKLYISNYENIEKCLHVIIPNNIKVLQSSNMHNIETDDDGYINAVDINIKDNHTVSINLYGNEINKDDFTVLACQ